MIDRLCGSAERITGGASDPIPLDTPVLVAWPGVPTLSGQVVGQAQDGAVYFVETACGCSLVVLEAALIDLRPFHGVPLAVFADAGRA